jgi:hypothetical protein
MTGSGQVEVGSGGTERFSMTAVKTLLCVQVGFPPGRATPLLASSLLEGVDHSAQAGIRGLRLLRGPSFTAPPASALLSPDQPWLMAS